MTEVHARVRRSLGVKSEPLPQGMILRRNFLWSAAGTVVYAGSQWGMIAVLAKLGSPAWVGQYALGLALTAPVLLLTNLQLRAVQATDAGDQFAFGHYLAVRLVSIAVAAIVIAVVIVATRLDPVLAMLTAAIGLAKIIESVSDAFYGLLQKHERMDCVARSMILRGVLSLAAFAMTLYWRQDIFSAVLASAAVWLAVLAIYDLRSARRVLQGSLRPVWQALPMKSLAVIAAPLGVVMMLNALNVSIPRYVLEYLSGTAEVGIFAALAYVLVGQSTLINAMGQAAAPRLARLYAQGDRVKFWQLLKRLMAAGGTGGVAGVLLAVVAGPFVLTLLYESIYAAYNDVFIILMLGAVLANVTAFTGYGLTAARVFKAQVPLLAGESAVLTAACFVLIPVYGLRGAAMAFVVSKLCLTAARMWLLARTMRARRTYDREAVLMSHGS